MFTFVPFTVIITTNLSFSLLSYILPLFLFQHYLLTHTRITRLLLFPSHLEQNADGRGHAHHADTHHRHLVPAANRLLLHHMADQLLLGGHLWKIKRHGWRVRDRQRHASDTEAKWRTEQGEWGEMGKRCK